MENNGTVEERREKDKLALIEILKEMPIIQIACKKVGIGRATYYRWRIEDEEFAQTSDMALRDGVDFINDMSESQIIQLIKEKKLPAIALWLKHNNPRYGAKSISRSKPSSLATLTIDEEKLFRKALLLSAGNITKIHAKRNQSKRLTENTSKQKLAPTPSL